LLESELWLAIAIGALAGFMGGVWFMMMWVGRRPDRAMLSFDENRQYDQRRFENAKALLLGMSIGFLGGGIWDYLEAKPTEPGELKKLFEELKKLSAKLSCKRCWLNWKNQFLFDVFRNSAYKLGYDGIRGHKHR